MSLRAGFVRRVVWNCRCSMCASRLLPAFRFRSPNDQNEQGLTRLPPFPIIHHAFRRKWLRFRSHLLEAPSFNASVGAWLSLVERTVRDREVGGSNPLAPTNQFKHLRLPAKVAVLVLWQDCGRRAILPLRPLLVSLDPLRACNDA